MRIQIAASIFSILFSAQTIFAQSTLSMPPKEPANSVQNPQPSNNTNRTKRKHNSSQSKVAPSAPDGKINGHGYVDLGLPSGLKWATCNVGATSPENYGLYFAWGEVKSKSSYKVENSETDGRNCAWLYEHGYVDAYCELTPQHDAAQYNWGGSWRMPTKEEIEELITHTTTRNKSINSVVGRLIISRINGKSIFIPCSGYSYDRDTELIGKNFYCWSSSLNEDDNFYSYDLRFFPDVFMLSETGRRSNGRSVRAVSR